MQKKEIQVGAEYAAKIQADYSVRLDRGIGGYAGRLARVRIVETNHEYEAKIRGVWSGDRTETRRGYLVELVEPFEGRSLRRDESPPVWEAGARVVVETGREIVASWAMYERVLAAYREEAARAASARDRSHARWGAISAALAERGLEVTDPRKWSDPSKEIENVRVSLDVLEALLGLADSTKAAAAR